MPKFNVTRTIKVDLPVKVTVTVYGEYSEGRMSGKPEDCEEGYVEIDTVIIDRIKAYDNDSLIRHPPQDDSFRETIQSECDDNIGDWIAEEERSA